MEKLLLQILECLRCGQALDDVSIAKMVRKANTGVTDVSKHISKKKLLPFYLRVREEEPERWASWEVDEDLEKALVRTLRAKPRRTASGVATITVITKPQACGSDCLYCPNDLRMPKSYLFNEPACRRAERNFFDPYLQVASRLFTLTQMGHLTDKVELIVLGGTWVDYPQEYRIWFIRELFRALNDSEPVRRSEVSRIREAYNAVGISSKEDELERFVEEMQAKVDAGELTYNQAFPLLYGPGTNWAEAAENQRCSWKELEAEHSRNENAENRCVGLVVETRPDTITVESLLEIRRLGCTKVQTGVQSLSQEVLAINGRCTQEDAAAQAFGLLRLFGFKIHSHFMANLYGSSLEQDRQEYIRFMTEKPYQPDEVKLYPCALIGGTRLCNLYKNGEWQPYEENDLVDLMVHDTLATPAFTRISRMIRDFSAEDIVAGCKKTNLRQLVDSRLSEQGQEVCEIRFREIGLEKLDVAQLRLEEVAYETYDTSERFLQWVTPQGHIAGFLRLSLPHPQSVEAMRPLGLPVDVGEAMIREVHVYGKVASVAVSGAESGGVAQHSGLGRKLVERACELAREAGYSRINVISAVGTRGYYRKLGFGDNGLYQQRNLR